jgi:hypothetical protein
MPEEERLVVALWIVQAHSCDQFDFSGYLAVNSPEKQCGKTTLLELVELVVPRPFPCVTPSESVLFRLIDDVCPTLLLDEVDAIFSPKTADRYEGLRAVLNAGFKKGMTVPRVNARRGMKIEMFSVYCPKLLAGIGTLPETIADRSFPIRLQKKTRDERIERFRVRDAKVLASPIKAAVAAWAETHGDALAEARPELPDELGDRQQDVCEPLLAIADALGCGVEARAALVSLFTAERADVTESAQVRLLRDIRDIFEQAGNPTALFTETLVSCLWITDEGGWDNWYGRPLGSRGIVSLLKPYGIASVAVRDGENVKRGYRFADFADAWDRYLEPRVTEVTEI